MLSKVLANMRLATFAHIVALSPPWFKSSVAMNSRSAWMDGIQWRAVNDLEKGQCAGDHHHYVGYEERWLMD